jgi:hypothetical protein
MPHTVDEKARCAGLRVASKMTFYLRDNLKTIYHNMPQDFTESLWFSSGAGISFSLGRADADQWNPRWRIAGRKGFDQALGDVVCGARSRFDRLQGPGVCPALSASMARYPGRHRRCAG